MEQEEELEKLRREKLQREEIELYKLTVVQEEDERKMKGLAKSSPITILNTNNVFSKK